MRSTAVGSGRCKSLASLFCVLPVHSVVRSAGEVARIDTKPLADSQLRKPLGDRAKLADPTPIARGSRNRDVEIE